MNQDHTPQPPLGFTKLLGFFTALLVVCIALAATAAWTLRGRGGVASDPNEGPLPVLNQLPDFSLTERSGRTITLADLRGSVSVVNFIFTRCPGPCPLMSQRFRELQRDLGKLNDLRLASISIDPEHDTPEVLAQYATDYQADGQKWLFLTGEKAAIVRLAVDGFKLAAGDDPSLHSTRFVLVDRIGQIRGYYSSGDPSDLRRLRRDVRRLARDR